MSNRDNRKVNRVQLDVPLEVIMASIGSEVKYTLATRSISPNGFFLEFQKPGRFPFTKSSIMEVWLKIGDEDTIFFNGKMARVVYPDEHNSLKIPGIAIKIVQIEPRQEERLIKFIEQNVNGSKTSSLSSVS